MKYDSYLLTLQKSEQLIDKSLPVGSQLFCGGAPCDHYVIVKSGTVRVEMTSLAGQQLLLYRIEAGESCVMTTSCLISGATYYAEAFTETAVDLLLLPKAFFHRQLTESEQFRQFVFSDFSARLAALLKRTTELTTNSIDQRLASALLAHKEVLDSETRVPLTHQQLAVEVGSAREVISRRLSDFEKRGLVERQRGGLILKDIDTLSAMMPGYIPSRPSDAV